MAPDRRKQILLAALVGVLLVVASRVWRTSVIPLPSSNGAAARAAAGADRRETPAPTAGVPDVHLDALKEARGEPDGVPRNLFRFKPKAPPPAPVQAARAGAPVAPPVSAPTGPPPPPPIALKFIGIVERANRSERLAVLSDGRGGSPISGKEGDIIEGRFRILRIGNESIEMAYLDGRGRQTIRLSGS